MRATYVNEGLARFAKLGGVNGSGARPQAPDGV